MHEIVKQTQTKYSKYINNGNYSKKKMKNYINDAGKRVMIIMIKLHSKI